MNLDDESLLSAYLDDELDPADRLAVEWSVESSPPLADQLRSLATSRDAVSGLGRPALPFDLAPAITARLAADRRRARLQAPARPGRVALAVACLSGMAASLLFALLLLYRATHDRPDGPPIAQQDPEDAAPRNHLIAIDDPEPKFVPPSTVVQNPMIPSPPGAVPVPLLKFDSDGEAREREDRLKITKMLENPEVRVILIATDVIDAPSQIHGLIEKNGRATADFGRITLRTGIVVDPNRPGSAEVFVVPIHEGARESFVNRLRGRFHDLKEEDQKRVPDLVTQLTEIGQVAICQGTQAAPLVGSPVEVPPLAVRTDTGPVGGEILPPRRIGSENPADSPRPPDDKRPVDASPPVGQPRLKPGDSVTLVVWVTRPGKT